MRIILLLASFLISFSMATVTKADDAAKANSLALATNAFLDTGVLPVLYTCDGKDVSPQLSWSNVPAKTKSLVLILSDPDAPTGTWYHWVVYNIPKETAKLAEGINPLPAGVLAGKNSWDKAQYNGPCPPKGTAHTYIFTLYALDNKLSLPAGADGKTVMSAIKNHTLQKTQLSTVYSRWLN